MTKVMICDNPRCGCQNLVRRVETQKLKDDVVEAAKNWHIFGTWKSEQDMHKAVNALMESQK